MGTRLEEALESKLVDKGQLLYCIDTEYDQNQKASGLRIKHYAY